MKNLNKKPRLTKKERAAKILTPELKDILVGLLLGDLHIRKDSPTINSYLRFEQGLIHKDYLFHLHDLFQNYCKSGPKISNRKPDLRTNKIYTRVTCNTLSLPCLNEFYLLFYLDGKKVVPKNIGDLLTPAGLAMWSHDDGHLHSSGNNFLFSTESYTLKEVELLVSVRNLNLI
jgi:LAGLIDADG DNA endonuclease family